MKTVLIIDNYDSFVYNIAQLVGDLGYIPLVLRNDEITITGVKRLRPEK
jgi:Anthranilate/para-aminobenzoate synthases component II